MAYCGPRGIPYTHWLGGRDQWDDLSRAAAVAWSRREADRCGGCGTVRSETSPDDFRNPQVVADMFACPVCRVIELARPDPADQDHEPWHHLTLRPASPQPVAGAPTVTG